MDEAPANQLDHSDIAEFLEHMDEMTEMEKTIDEVYEQRNLLVQLLIARGAEGYLREPDSEWPVLCFETGTGHEVSFHVPQHELLPELKQAMYARTAFEWDGATWKTHRQLIKEEIRRRCATKPSS